MSQQKPIDTIILHRLPLFALLFAFNTQAQQGGGFEIPRHSIDSGSSISSSAELQVHGTIGQIDIQLVTGDEYTLQAGFWVSAPTDALFEDQFEGQPL